MKTKKKSTIKDANKKAKASPTRASLKLSKNIKIKKKIEKKTESDKKGKKENNTGLIAQEIKFARLLANNDKRVRDKVLKNLRKWLIARSSSSFAFTEADFMRIWKGLFYCMWMSDKPLIQEELSESISKLIHCFASVDAALLYSKCALKTFVNEWFGIDRYRLDKFQMLVRRILRQIFEVCKKNSWNTKWVKGFEKIFEQVLLEPKTTVGFNFHFTEIYLEELAKVSDGDIPSSIVTEFLRPFVIYLTSVNDIREVKHVVKNIFRQLIFQSDVGMDYLEKFQAWRDAGFPCQNIDEMQLVEISDDENEDDIIEITEKHQKSLKTTEKPLDPRAGRVNVEIPQLPFDAKEIAELLAKNKFNKSSTTLTRKHISKMIDQFNQVSHGKMPMGIKHIERSDIIRPDPQKAAEQLLKLDGELYSDSAKNNKKRKVPLDFDVAEEPILKKKLSDSPDSVSEPQQIQNKKVKKLKAKLKSKKIKNKKKAHIGEFKVTPVTETTSEKKKVVGNTLNVEPEVTEITIEAGESDTKCNAKSQSTDVKTCDLKQESPKKVKVVKQKSARKSLGKQEPPLLVLTRLEQEVKKTPVKQPVTIKTPLTDPIKKRVTIALKNNTEQHTSEYIRQLKQSPAIPFDANRKPKVGVLKPSPLPSPVNPFYNIKRKSCIKY